MTNEENLILSLGSALGQIFAVIFLGIAFRFTAEYAGYFLSRFKVFDAKLSGGYGRFAGLLSLPCLVFVQLATMDLSNIAWSLLIDVYVGKMIGNPIPARPK